VTAPSSNTRRVILAIVAVALPSITLVALGTRLLVQESRLASQQQSEQIDAAYRDAAASLDSLATRAAQSAFEAIADPSVLLVLPKGSSQTSIAAPMQAWSRAMERGQELEFRSNNPASAVRAYREASNAATNPANKAAALHATGRAQMRSQQAEAAAQTFEEVLYLDPNVRDENGVPYSLYGAASLLLMDQVEPVIPALDTHIAYPIDLTSLAAYQYRSVRDSLAITYSYDVSEAFDQFVDDALAVAQLKQDLPSITSFLRVGTSETSPWMLTNKDRWFVGQIVFGDQEAVVALDVEMLIAQAFASQGLQHRGFESLVLRSSGDEAQRYLGPRFAGVFAGLVQSPDALQAGMSAERRLFVILAGLLVIGLLSLGVFLLLRDTRRELEMARVRSEFVSSVSHELKTPLTTIRMYAETLRLRRQDDATREAYLDTIISESERLTRLMNNVLDFSRIESGTRHYAMQRVAVQNVVQSTLNLFKSILDDQSVALTTSIQETPLLVDADADALEQAMLNLLSNAVKYSPETKEVAVDVRGESGRAIIAVSDSGMGISEEARARLFEPYFRAEDAQQAGIAGTGLGLSIVRHAAEAHGGTVSVQSEPGRGSTFTLSLPLAAEVAS